MKTKELDNLSEKWNTLQRVLENEHDENIIDAIVTAQQDIERRINLIVGY